MTKPQTRAEIEAYNTGVEAVLAAARRTSATLAISDKRRLHVGFAVAALDELAEAGRALLRPVQEQQEAA